MLLETKPVLLIDSREQRPYDFKRYSDRFNGPARKQALLAGDYSLAGHETAIAMERKSLQDLVNTIVHNRDRFKVELAKLSQYQHAAIVIEASMFEVSRPYSFSKANPASVLGSLRSFQLTYGVQVIFANDRVRAEDWIAETLLMYHKYTSQNQP